MQKYFNYVTRNNGRPAQGANVAVTNYVGGTDATIYSDDGVTLISGNDLTTDTLGYFEFYAADGRYTLTISGTGLTTTTLDDIILEDPADGNDNYVDVLYQGGVLGATALRALTPVNGDKVYLAYHTTAGDGGHGWFRGVTGAAAATYTHDNGITFVASGGDGSAAWIREYSGNIHVSWFGAAGGGTNSSTAIQAALDAAEVSGGVVFAQAGEYTIDAQLSIGSNVSLIGEGKATSFNAKNALEADMIVNNDTVSGNTYIKIYNIEFDGNRANQTTTGGAIHLNNVDEFDISKCTILNAFNDGIYIDNSASGTISDCYTKNCGADSYTVHNTFDISLMNNVSESSGATGTGGGGIVVIDSSGRIILHGNVCNNATNANGNGIVVQNSTNAIISNNICNGNAASGIESDTGTGRHTIIGNQCVGNTGRGIYILISECIVEGNMCSGNTNHGMSFLSPAIRNVIRGNICVNNTGAGIENNGDETIISGNTCTFNQNEGIRMGSGTDDCTVTSNICRNNSQSGAGSYPGINILGSIDCVFSNNRCIDSQGTKTQSYGIRETGSSDYNIYTNNSLRDSLTGPYTIVGVNNIVDGNITGESVDVASATAVTLPYNGNYFNITGTTDITSITASRSGREVTLKFADVLTFTDGSNLVLAGNFVTTADDTITLVCNGTNWYEKSRSIN